MRRAPKLAFRANEKTSSFRRAAIARAAQVSRTQAARRVSAPAACSSPAQRRMGRIGEQRRVLAIAKIAQRSSFCRRVRIQRRVEARQSGSLRVRLADRRISAFRAAEPWRVYERANSAAFRAARCPTRKQTARMCA